MSRRLFKIKLNEIKLYGFHGVTNEEQNVGSWFTINLVVQTEVNPESMVGDRLSGTVDYSKLSDCIVREFEIKSKLLEHLAFRISKSLFENFQTIEQITIEICKQTPPISVNMKSASVEFVFSKEDLLL